MEYYLALKRNEVMIHTAVKTHGKLKCILPNEEKQSDMSTYHVIPAIYLSLERLTTETGVLLGGTSDENPAANAGDIETQV